VGKIVFFLPDVVGGVASVVNNILQYAPDGSNVDVIAYSDSRISRKTLDPMLYAGSFSRFIYNGDDSNFFTAKRLFRQTPSDLACIVATDVPELKMVQRLRLNKPVVYIVLGDFGHYYDLALHNEGIIDSYIAISREIENRLIHLLPHRRQDIHLAYAPTPAVPVKRTPAGNTDPLRIIYVARLEEGKNPLILPRIDALLKTNGIEVQWTVVGDGPLRAQLETAIGDAENFTLTGFLSSADLSRQYTSHDIFMLPSEYEGLPVSLIEAMKTGLTPIVSDLPGGIREVVEPGIDGFLCPPSDEKAFAAAIRRLHEDRGLLEHLSAKAEAFADLIFDPGKCANRYWNVIDEAVKAAPRRKKHIIRRNGALDREWLPNIVVRLLRKVQYRNPIKSE